MSSLYRASRLGPARRDARRFVSSIESDKYLFESVVKINQAHTVMLGRKGIIARNHTRRILRALGQIRAMPKSQEAEDVHVAIEETVTRRAGKSAGGNLQLAKSRNDQVATAIRMRLRSEVLQIMDLLIDLLAELQKTARKHYKTLVIGRTHLQPAEPTTYGHYLMAFHDAILRDLQRLEEFYPRLNLSPMGGCALAGTSIPIDRGIVAALLGFDGLVENSLDAVGSRDFALEFLAGVTQLAVDISRLAEDFIFLTTPEVSQLQLPEDLAFTSSIMPQKKNPDVIELVRAKCAVPIGAFCQTATILHSLPTSYNLDLQEVTPNIWMSSRAIQDVTAMLRTLISRTKVRDVDLSRADLTMTTATELANMLVTELGVPFRLAHQVVASAASEFSRGRSKKADSWPELILQKALTVIPNRSGNLKAGLARAETVVDIVTHKRSLGSPAPRETLRLLRIRGVTLRQ
ncbi:argininosuccinate lyase, partial [[Eubacterium] cellulosolvens]